MADVAELEAEWGRLIALTDKLSEELREAGERGQGKVQIRFLQSWQFWQSWDFQFRQLWKSGQFEIKFWWLEIIGRRLIGGLGWRSTGRWGGSVTRFHFPLTAGDKKWPGIRLHLN